MYDEYMKSKGNSEEAGDAAKKQEPAKEGAEETKS